MPYQSLDLLALRMLRWSMHLSAAGSVLGILACVATIESRLRLALLCIVMSFGCLVWSRIVLKRARRLGADRFPA